MWEVVGSTRIYFLRTLLFVLGQFLNIVNTESKALSLLNDYTNGSWPPPLICRQVVCVAGRYFVLLMALLAAGVQDTQFESVKKDDCGRFVDEIAVKIILSDLNLCQSVCGEASSASNHRCNLILQVNMADHQAQFSTKTGTTPSSANGTHETKHWSTSFLLPSTERSPESSHTRHKRALIVLNQPFSFSLFNRLWSSTQHHFCADGGANRVHDLLREVRSSAESTQDCGIVEDERL